MNSGGDKFTTWEHKVDGLFNCDNLTEGTLPGLFDVCTSDKLFELDPEGISDIDFGNILAPGLNYRQINSATGSISGSMLPLVLATVPGTAELTYDGRIASGEGRLGCSYNLG